MKPGISLLDYLRRILKYVKIEYTTLIIAMIYIDRICKEKVFLNEFNIHRIMLISIYMAYTYNEDRIYDNKYLALVSGLNKSEMLLLEEDFLDLKKMGDFILKIILLFFHYMKLITMLKFGLNHVLYKYQLMMKIMEKNIYLVCRNQEVVLIYMILNKNLFLHLINIFFIITNI